MKEKDLARLCDDITDKFLYHDPADRQTVWNDLQATLPILQQQTETSSCELAKSFVELVWRIEKYCHSPKDIPVESVFHPNFDVYRILGLYIASHIFQHDHARITAFIGKAMEDGIMWGRFGHLMLATLLRDEGRLKEAYEHARMANDEFSQCGASYRIHYECWEACQKAGIPVQETFPSQEFIQKKFCPLPFEFLSIRNDGTDIILAPCQTSLWMSYAKTYSTKLLASPDQAPDFWNSPEFQELRRSILDGDFKYCSKVRCPKLFHLTDAKDITEPRLRDIIDNRRIVLPRGPKVLVLGYDETCNLTCPSCRKHPVVPSPALRHSFDIMADRFIIPMISSEIDYILLNCSGEALASPHTLRLLNALPFEQFPQLKIHLMSNGELLADRWERMGPAANHVSNLVLSFDGITEETYTRYRRGGSLKKFLAGMEFAAQLKQEKRISHVRAVMTIFAGNMHEAIPIYKFCSSHDFDSLMLNKFQNWGTFSAKEFASMDVWNTSHPRHAEWTSIFHELQALSKHNKTLLNSTNII